VGSSLHYAVTVAAELEGRPADAAQAEEPSHILGIAKQTIVYGLSGVAIQAVGVITLPVYGRLFTPAQFGLLELATVVSSVGVALVDAGFASAAQRSFYDYTDDELDRRRSVIFTAITFTSVLAGIAALVLLLARNPISDWLFGGHGRGLVIAVAVSFPLINFANFFRETMRLRFRAWHYVASSALASVVAAAAGIVAVVVFDRGVAGVFIGLIVGNALAAAYGAAVVWSDVAGRFSRPELRTMLAYGLPLIPAALALWALALVDRIMLNKLGSLQEVGQYAVANRISNVLLLLVTGFALAFGPYIFSIYGRDPELEKQVRGQTLRYLIICLSAAALALTLFAREIVSVVAPAFDDAYKAVGLLTFSVVAFGISTVVMAGISIVRRTKVLALLALVAAALNIGLNFILIPPFGMVGAAVATAAAYALLAVLHFRVAQRYYPTPYEPPKVLTALGLATAFGILSVVPLGPVAVAVAVKVLALVGYLALLRIFRVVEAGDIASIRELLSGLMRTREPPA
jgi:O-antigen/teichoic acid export membrane protein